VPALAVGVGPSLRRLRASVKGYYASHLPGAGPCEPLPRQW